VAETKTETPAETARVAPKNKCEIYTRAEHGISRRQIDPEAIKIMYRLIRNGYKAYLVGGGVRDLLLNKTPKDFDIATNATPRRIKDLFRNSRIIGRRFKLIHVFFRGNKIIEVSTFRDISDPIEPEDADGESEGLIIRDNKYGTEETDALRRDITINALFYDISSFSIIDYVGGMRDLRAGIVRMIGDPDVRFAEDPVRLIRVVRHACKAGFSIEENCYASLRRSAHLIEKSPGMRVYEEFKKDFVTSHALKVLRLLAETGVLQHTLPINQAGASALLDKESEFARLLANSDQSVMDGQARSHSFPLALLALFTKAPFLEAALDEFSSFESIEEHLSSIYSILAVPRREKERLAMLIAGFVTVCGSGDWQIRASQIVRSEMDEELIYLTRMIYGEGPELLKVEEFLDSANAERGAARRNSGGRRRGRGPRGRRARDEVTQGN
jgi:poly(A) polymerase